MTIDQQRQNLELRERLEICRRFGSILPAGVVFDEWLEGPDGAGFRLFRESHHTDDDIKRAKDRLRRDRDVVRIEVVVVK